MIGAGTVPVSENAPTCLREEIVVEYVDTCFMLVCCDGPVWGFYLAVISPISRSFSCV